MKSEELHQELRQRILNLPGVKERQNAGIHEDAFFVGRTMFMHIHGRGHCDIRLPKSDQERVLAEGKARTHRWAPEAGYVTLIVDDEEDLDPAMDLIRMRINGARDRQTLLPKLAYTSRKKCDLRLPSPTDRQVLAIFRAFLSPRRFPLVTS